MGYRDDVVKRLQQDGLWDQLSVEQQARFRKLSDEQARQIMVMDDLWEMGEKEAIEVFGLMSLVQVIGSFSGALVNRGGEGIGELSEAGRLLAQFFLELRQQGVSPDEISDGLQKLSPMVIAALIAAYKGPSEES